MTNKHTLGPWAATKYEAGYDPQRSLSFYRVDSEEDGCNVCDFVSDEAAARLIAAAPDLLDIAQNILAPDLFPYLPADYVTKVQAVIAKATGVSA